MIFKTIGIVGFGRFGRLMYELLSSALPDAQIKVLSSSNEPDNQTFFSKQEVYSCSLIIPCVPISAFEKTISEMTPDLNSGQTILDICSVMLYPKEVLGELPEGINTITSHPMFGPNTYRKLGNSVKGLKCVVNKVNCEDDIYNEVLELFKTLELTIVEMSAEEHDRLSAKFQFLTQIASNALRPLNIKKSNISTKSADTMVDFIEMVGVDQQLTKDLYKYNPFCKQELEKLKESFSEVVNFIEE